MAVPNPERELKRLRGVLRGKELPQVLVISGPSRFFRGEAIDLVVEAVPKDADLRRTDGDETTDGAELDDLLGGGLFGSGSWLVVRRGDAWLKTHGAVLGGRVTKIGAGCGLVLEVAKLNGRSKVGKALADAGEVFTFRDPYAEPYDRSRSPLEAELCGWIESRSRAAGLRLTPEAAFLVQSTVGNDPADLVAEIGRMVSSLGAEAGDRTLTPDDLRAHLSVQFESTPFEFADAVLAFDRARAMRSLEAMFARGVKGRDGAQVGGDGVFPFVTRWLWQVLSQAHSGRRLLESGVRLGDVPGRVGVRSFVERFSAQVRDNPSARLRRGLLLLHTVQRELRSTGEEPHWLLERFLARYFREAA